MIQTPEGREKIKSYQIPREDSGESTPEQIGCTACSALITKDEIIVANAGDSRAVWASRKADGKYEHKDLSVDHKPELADEKARIEKAGGFVWENRVKGELNLSRSLGDL